MSETAAQVQARADATNERGHAAAIADGTMGAAFALWAEADLLYRLADALDARTIDWRRGLPWRVDEASRVALGD